MSDTKDERMAEDPQLKAANLLMDLSHMRFSGFWPEKVECGPLVFEFLIEHAIINSPPTGDGWDEESILAREERMRREMRKGLTGITFEGLPVECCDDVPDGRIWPMREKGGLAVPPFRGTEAALC